MEMLINEYICIDCAVKKGLHIPADPFVSVVYIGKERYFVGNEDCVECSFCGKRVKKYYTRTVMEEI